MLYIIRIDVFVIGLVSDEIRSLVWPVLASSLVHCSFSDQETSSTFSDSDFESAHSDFIYEENDSVIDSVAIVSFFSYV